MPSPRPNFISARRQVGHHHEWGSPTAARTVLATRVCLSAREASSAFQCDSCATQLREFRRRPPRTHSMPLLQICLPRAASHHLPATMRRPTALAVTVWVLVGGTAQAQPAPTPQETVVISGSGSERRAFETPYAVSVVDAAELRSAGPMVNLSESLSRVPGPGGQPAQQLRAGPAAQLARLRRARHLRHPRPAPVHRRHPRHHARRPGPGVALRHRRRAAHRGAARAVLGAVRRQLRRRDLAGQRRARGNSLQRRTATSAATACGRRAWASKRRWPAAGTCAPGQPVQHRRLSPAQRGAAHAGQRAAGLGRRPGPRDAAAQQRGPAGAGPAGPDARAVRRRPVPDHAAGDAVRHPQDHAARPRAAPPGATASPMPARCARACSPPTPGSAT